MVRRGVIQFISTIVCNANWRGFRDGTVYTGKTKSFCVPGLNCYSCPGALGSCPVGSLQSSLSGFLPRIPLYVLGLLVLFGILFGRVVCGFLCPFGFFQELLYKLPVRKVGKSALTRKFTYGKYVFLALVCVGPPAAYVIIGLGEPLFCKYICPAGTIEGAVPLFIANDGLRSAAGMLTAWKGFLAAVLVMVSIVIFRPFCRFICPLGALYGFFNKYSLLGIAVDNNRCVNCGRCAAVCKSDVRIAGDRECISCGDCITMCPVDAIYMKKPISRRMKEEKND
ncbi:4Fe-4S binding protein [Colibacter massiliensis]|uniref:4Fe-4S binding protein n=1 Tax=Colibacter massiliensis TaxID=1852379 RepID=UPI003F910D68